MKSILQSYLDLFSREFPHGRHPADGTRIIRQGNRISWRDSIGLEWRDGTAWKTYPRSSKRVTGMAAVESYDQNSGLDLLSEMKLADL